MCENLKFLLIILWSSNKMPLIILSYVNKRETNTKSPPSPGPTLPYLYFYTSALVYDLNLEWYFKNTKHGFMTHSPRERKKDKSTQNFAVPKSSNSFLWDQLKYLQHVSDCVNNSDCYALHHVHCEDTSGPFEAPTVFHVNCLA